jgi:hypothetical protein
MAPLLVMPEKLLHRIPDSLDFSTAALIEPTANTVHDVLERATVDRHLGVAGRESTRRPQPVLGETGRHRWIVMGFQPPFDLKPAQ